MQGDPTPDRDKMADERLGRVYHWHNRPRRMGTLAFMKDQFERTIEKPYKQLNQMSRVWQRHVPEAVSERCTLKSFARGTLTVVVTDSGTLYQLDRLLRGGVEAAMRKQFTGTLKRVRIEVGPAEGRA